MSESSAPTFVQTAYTLSAEEFWKQAREEGNKLEDSLTPGGENILDLNLQDTSKSGCFRVKTSTNHLGSLLRYHTMVFDEVLASFQRACQVSPLEIPGYVLHANTTLDREEAVRLHYGALSLINRQGF